MTAGGSDGIFENQRLGDHRGASGSSTLIRLMCRQVAKSLFSYPATGNRAIVGGGMGVEFDQDSREPGGPGRFSPKAQSNLLRRLISLPTIARNTAGYHIIPASTPASTARNHVVQGQFRARTPLATILATPAVSGQNVLSSEFNMVFGPTEMVAEACDSGHLNRQTDRSDRAIVFLHYIYFA